MQSPHKPGVSGGGDPLIQETFGTFFSPKFVDIFLAIFFHFLESSEKHFDLIASKIFHNIIYGDIVTIFSSKSTISQRIKIAKFRKIILSQVSEHCATFNLICPLLREGRGGAGLLVVN